MSAIYQPVAEITPSKKTDTYVYALKPTSGNGLAAITSADELIVLDRQDLTSGYNLRFDDTPKGVNCLESIDETAQSLICSGSDGTVAIYDLRSKRQVSRFRIDRAVTALACNTNNKVAVGTELSSHNQSTVSLWDLRVPRQVWQNAENNDDITALQFHPTRPNVLLAGGDDGVVSIFDTNIIEEEDSLIQGFDHGPVFKAGFLGEHRIYALSSDQQLAIHPVSTLGDEIDPLPTIIGDVRPSIPCEYVVDVLKSGNDYVLAAGTNIQKSQIDLVKIDHALDLKQAPSLDLSVRHVLEPAHGEEVVRSVYLDPTDGVIFTAGEDGYIRAYRESQAIPSPSTTKGTKAKKGSDVRYKPY